LPPALAAGAVAAALAVGLGAPRAAEARLIDLHAGALAGGMTGWGSDSKTPDFFDKTKGGAVGAEVGVKLLVFDFSVRFLQVLDRNGASGTLSEATLGLLIDVPISDGKTPEGKEKWIFRPGLNGGFGFGTPAPVKPPLSADQISDKGLVSNLRLGLEYNIFDALAIGVEGDAGYHYFLGGQVVNDAQSHSSGIQAAGLATLTFHLGY
jgi:hypothetical protein